MIRPGDPRVVEAVAGDRGAVTATLTAAFADDPAVRWLYPGDALYRRAFPAFVAAYGGAAFSVGIVDRTADDSGAALWLLPGTGIDDGPLVAWLRATVPAERQPGLFAGYAELAALHPRERHWYLPFIGVRPEAQGRGIGAALMRRCLARIDRTGLPACLEATSLRNVGFYRRFGFAVTARIERPDYPHVVAMRRPGVL
jgi:ribosomal protein S18 acetylase RimI-like enzyme